VLLLALSGLRVVALDTPGARTGSIARPEVEEVVKVFMGWEDSGLTIGIRELPHEVGRPAKICRYACTCDVPSTGKRVEAYFTIDTERLYVLTFINPCTGPRPETALSAEELRRIAMRFIESHYPGLEESGNLSLGPEQLLGDEALFMWVPKRKEPYTGARAVLRLSTQTGQVTVCSVYLPPRELLTAKLAQAQAEGRARSAMADLGLAVAEARSVLVGASPLAPHDGPVWVVGLRVSPPDDSPQAEPGLHFATVVVDAVAGGLLWPLDLVSSREVKP